MKTTFTEDFKDILPNVRKAKEAFVKESPKLLLAVEQKVFSNFGCKIQKIASSESLLFQYLITVKQFSVLNV